MRPAATSRSTIHLPHISTILFSLSEIWTMTLSASTVEYHQRCCSPTNFFLSARQPSVVPSIGTSTTYIVFVLSVAPQSPVHALYWRTKPRCLRQPPQTTQMPLPIYLHAPRPQTPSPIFLDSPHKHTTHNTTMTKAPTGNKAAKHRNERTCRLPPVSHSRQLLGEY